MMDNINETFIMISGYTIIIFSQWIYDVMYNKDDQDIQDLPELRYNIGYIYLGFLGMTIIINLTLIIFEIGKMCRKNYRKRIYYNKWGYHYKVLILNRHYRLNSIL